MLIDLNRFIGIPYKLGGRAHAGADCVGIIWLYLQENGIIVPDGDGKEYQEHWRKDDPARYKRAILKEGTLVEVKHEDFVFDLLPMDILMFDAENTGDITHAGIYIGFGRFLHSTLKSGSVISSFSNDWWRRRFRGAVRLGKTYAGKPVNEEWLEYAQGPVAIVGAVIGAIIGTTSMAAGGYIFGATLLASVFSGIAYGSSIGGIIENLGKSPDVASPTYEFGALGNTIANQLPVPIIYGWNKVGGNIIWQTDPGSEIKRFVVLGEGEIQSIQDVRINDIPIAELSGCSVNIYLGTPIQNVNSRAIIAAGEDIQTRYRNEGHGPYSNLSGNTFILSHIPVVKDSENVFFKIDAHPYAISRSAQFTINYNTGAITINPGLGAGFDGKIIYVSYHHLESVASATQLVYGLRYTAYLALTLVVSDQLTGGDPTVTELVEGLKVQVWDGAQYVVQYSNNPAWCIRNFIINSRYALGGLSSADLDEQSFIDTANYCETLISTPDGGTEPRYQLDYVIDTRKPGLDILTEMLLTFGGFLVYSGGKFKLRVEKNESAIQSFTMDNIKNESFQYAKKALAETPNRVIVEFRDPENNWVMVETMAEDKIDQDDRGIVEQRVALYGIIRFTQASRMAKTILYTSKFNPRVTQITVGIDSLHCEVGDIVNVSHDVPGWVNKPFRIVSIAEKEDDEMDLMLMEYNGSIFDDGFGSTIIYQDYSTLPHENQPPEHVINLTVTEEVPNFAITFNQPLQNVFWAYADILVSIDGGVTYEKIGESRGEKFVYPDAIPGKTYYIKVISVNTNDIRASLSTAPVATITVLGNTPPDVTGLQVFGQGNDAYWTGKDCKFTWNWSSKTTGAGFIGAGNDALGAGEGYIDPYFMDFEVQILVNGIVKRTEHIIDNFYTYTFEKNTEDNGSPSPTFTIRVWQRNIYNKKSTNPAELSVYNSAPGQVQGLTIDFTGKDLIISWAESSDLDLDYYKINITGAGGTKTQYISATKLVYPYDQNVQDHGGVGDPSLTVDIYAVDAFSQVSPVSSIGAVNPAPSNLGAITAVSGFRSVSFWWTPSPETDLKYYKIRHKIASAGWSDWSNITDNFYSRILSASEINTYGVTATIYFEAKAIDVFDQESALAQASAGAAEDVKQIDINGEVFQIKPTDSDSNSVEIMKTLYDGIFSSGGVTYTISGPTKYIQYEFPIEQTFNKVILWPLATFNCYIGYSRDNVTWNYLKAEADHTLDANGKLLEAVDQADAETNYWTTGAPIGTIGIVGLWTYMRQAKYVRLYIKSSVTLYELKFWTYAVLDEIDAGTLHLAKGLSIASVDDNNNAVIMDTTGLKAYYNNAELGQTRLTQLTGEKGLEVLKDGVVHVQAGRLSSSVFGLWADDGGFGGSVAAPAIDLESDGFLVVSGKRIVLYKGVTPGELRFGASFSAADYFRVIANDATGLQVLKVGTLVTNIVLGSSGTPLDSLDVYAPIYARDDIVCYDTVYPSSDGAKGLGDISVTPKRWKELGLYPMTVADSPAEGTVRYVAANDSIEVYTSAGWKIIPYTTVAISEGGTGQTTAQAAINALTNVSAAANEHVLTKDTSTGNAIFKAASTGVSNIQLFTASGSWVAPAGTTKVYLTIVGGGAGGVTGTALAGGGGGGAGASVFNAPFTVVPATSYTVTVGGDAAANVAGNASSFDTLSIPGGGVGSGTTAGVGGGGLDASAVTAGGKTVKGGNGGAGVSSGDDHGGGGGGSPFGAGGNGAAGGGGAAGSPGTGYGSGGGGGTSGSGAGGAGKQGLVIVIW